MGKKVTTIPATISKYTAVPIGSKEKRKVAAYARVSTDHEEQLTSYEAQVDYYTKYIKEKDEWEFVSVYTDAGISGTSTSHRSGFLSMVSDALDGKINLIITKSVSRFARNTVDSLSTIRKLKENGIEVYFQKENIWTFDSKGELLISIMSSLAQEESRSISENVTWGQRKRFADGKVSVAYSTFLGYDKGEDGNLVINEEQAVTVRLIYRLFLEGMSPTGIAAELTRRKIKTPMGRDVWNQSTVRRCLQNEKMRGDALLQKEFTVDFLTKKHRKNEGQVPQYYVSGNHQPIIEPAVFDMVQAELQRRSGKKSSYSGASIFSSRIKCGDCGGWYGQKVWHSTDKYRKVICRCNRKYTGEHKCGTPALSEEEIKSAFIIALNRLIEKKSEIAEGIDLMQSILCDTEPVMEEIARLENEMAVVRELTKNVVAEAGSPLSNQEDITRRYEELAKRYEKAELELATVKKQKTDRLVKAEAMSIFKEKLLSQENLIDEFDKELWCSLVDYMEVFTKDRIKVVFRDGTQIEI